MVLGFKTTFPKSDKPTFFPRKIMEGTKIHSIREGDRWKAGMKIHFATGVRTKSYKQFHSGIVISVQDIHISPHPLRLINIDGRYLDEYEWGLLAENDGFDSESEFREWFKDGVIGQIIHFTDYKY